MSIKKTIKKKKKVTKMKIRLTENQYKRLLKEDDKSFLGGDVDFANIDNKVTPVIAKIFTVLKNKNFEPSSDYLRMKNPIESQNFRKIAEELSDDYEPDEFLEIYDKMMAKSPYNFITRDIRRPIAEGRWRERFIPNSFPKSRKQIEMEKMAK